ncbi:hypothetical protein S83_019568, partial [Arachis hypogaea]
LLIFGLLASNFLVAFCSRRLLGSWLGADLLCTTVLHHRSMQIAEALQMQMEVQKKLYEQIEVQRHLQLKIEAQGKYLQSVLHKAQETLAGMINNGSPGSPSILELTETRGGFSWSCGQRKQNRGTMCSLEI